MASLGSGRLRAFHSWPGPMIRVDAIWLATEPMDMRVGTETALARVAEKALHYVAALYEAERSLRAGTG